MAKIHCPRHNDENPSVEVYETAGFCFSGCGVIPLEELGGVTPTPKPKEDIQAKLVYIDTLPVKDIRGVILPYDSTGYYLIWPNREYYLLRQWDKEPKYIGPTGHQRPLYKILDSVPVKRLFLVEGEYNALSLATAFEYDYSDIISPGSAGEFKHLHKHLTRLSLYDTVYIIVDKDPAGVLAAIHAKSFLLGKIPNIKIIFTNPERDCNDILVTEGKDALRKEINKLMSKAL
jgi:hypothetical protein